jgi:hypothetical protein
MNIDINSFFGCQVSRFGLEFSGLDLQSQAEETVLTSDRKFQVLGLMKLLV